MDDIQDWPTHRSEIDIRITCLSEQADGQVKVDKDTLPPIPRTRPAQKDILDTDVSVQDVDFPQVPVA